MKEIKQREIKFRVWDIVNKCYLKSSTDNLDFIYNGQWLSVSKFIGSESYITQRWTGLVDKYGKDIYEGDIVKVIESNYDEMSAQEAIASNNADATYSHIGKIIWLDSECRFAFKRNKQKEAFNDLNYMIPRGIMEVIGDICQTPELIK